MHAMHELDEPRLEPVRLFTAGLVLYDLLALLDERLHRALHALTAGDYQAVDDLRVWFHACILKLFPRAVPDDVPPYTALRVLPNEQIGVAQDLSVQAQRLPARCQQCGPAILWLLPASVLQVALEQFLKMILASVQLLLADEAQAADVGIQ